MMHEGSNPTPAFAPDWIPKAFRLKLENFTCHSEKTAFELSLLSNRPRDIFEWIAPVSMSRFPTRPLAIRGPHCCTRYMCVGIHTRSDEENFACERCVPTFKDGVRSATVDSCGTHLVMAEESHYRKGRSTRKFVGRCEVHITDYRPDPL